jgi:lysozyme family protein
MSFFDRAFLDLIQKEGGYSDHASDPGGKTKFGITEAVARANGYRGPMLDLTLDRAKAIYHDQYWQTNRLETIARISPATAYELFDTGVNMGVGRAGAWLQQALNALNRGGRDHADLTVDGVVGPMTVEALMRYVSKRGAPGETVLVRMLNCLQGADYIRQAERNPAKEDFIYGWFANRVTI